MDTEERAIRAPLSKSDTRWSAIEMMIWSGPFGGSSGRALLRRFRVCLPVVVLVFERSVMAWPERMVGPKQKLSVCDPCREHENGEYCHCYRADGSDVDASGRGIADMLRCGTDN